MRLQPKDDFGVSSWHLRKAHARQRSCNTIQMWHCSIIHRIIDEQLGKCDVEAMVCQPLVGLASINWADKQG